MTRTLARARARAKPLKALAFRRTLFEGGSA
jgi:hypothetical protein